MDTCGIPSKANWYVNVVFSYNGQTSYTDMYLCDEHFPGYPDGSMTDTEVASLLKWDGHEQAEILHAESTRLR